MEIVEVFYGDDDPIMLTPVEEKHEEDLTVEVIWDEGFEPVVQKVTIAPTTRQINIPTPAEIDEMRIKQGELYRQKCKLANELVDIVDVSTLEQRKELVDQIIASKEEYNQLAVVVKHWEKTGQLLKKEEPVKVKLTDLQKHELLRKRTNTAANVSKKKNMVRKYQHQPEKLLKYQSQQAKLEAEIQEIDELLRA